LSAPRAAASSKSPPAADPGTKIPELQGKPDVRATAAEICALLAKQP
jgi:hypothetical protein